MCGILGGSKPNWNYQAAIESINHRGPDKQKIQQIKDFYLGFARLSIIDLNENAMQPMFSDDGNYVIVFNGEIYDYKQLRKTLEQKGYQFRTKSDTEVLLYSFVEWKEKMVEYIDGIFAVAIMDIRQERIYLFSDRPGVKPLYYFFDGKSFAFASELKAILKMCTDTCFDLDNTALYDYHTYLYIPYPKTMYKNVYKLPPASYIIYDIKKSKIERKSRYWKVNVNANEGEIISKKKLEDKAEELRENFERVIQRQIISDVPVGTFLSGGVDSSIVTAVTKKYISDVTGYSIGFTDRSYDESKYAMKIAGILNVNCKVKRFKNDTYIKLKQILPDLYDEPFADTSAYPTYFVSEFAKQDITVVLTGDGGDELFGGYPRCVYAAEKLESKRLQVNRKIKTFYMDYENQLKKKNINMDFIIKDDVLLLIPFYQFYIKPNRLQLRKKFHIDKDYDDAWFIRKHYHKELPPFTRMRYLDFMTYLPGDILTKVDRASMKVSLEARVPFLDRELIEFAFSLTQQECNPKGELKGLLKYAYKDVISLKLLNRKKAGFSMPHNYIQGNVSPQEILLKKLWGI
jgi:asparagine synthase (glutamine-hydrolysing)